MQTGTFVIIPSNADKVEKAKQRRRTNIIKITSLIAVISICLADISGSILYNVASAKAG